MNALVAGVQQQEVASAVRVLGHSLAKAGLAERRRLLVAEDARDGHSRQRTVVAAVAEDLARGANLGQHRHRDAHVCCDVFAPLESVEIHEHGARGVGHVGRVHSPVDTAGEVPEQPGVDRAEE